MNEKQKAKLSESIFYPMLEILLSPSKIKFLKDTERFEIAHNALANLIGAYLAEALNDLDHFDLAIGEIAKYAKVCARNYANALKS